jgi:hypothetical protein
VKVEIVEKPLIAKLAANLRMRCHAFGARAENHPAGRVRVAQRPDSHAIDREQAVCAFRVEHGESEAAADVLQALGAVASIRPGHGSRGAVLRGMRLELTRMPEQAALDCDYQSAYPLNVDGNDAGPRGDGAFADNDARVRGCAGLTAAREHAGERFFRLRWSERTNVPPTESPHPAPIHRRCSKFARSSERACPNPIMASIGEQR